MVSGGIQYKMGLKISRKASRRGCKSAKVALEAEMFIKMPGSPHPDTRKAYVAPPSIALSAIATDMIP